MTKLLKESPFFRFVSGLKKIIDEFQKKYPINDEFSYQEQSDYELISNSSPFLDRICEFMLLFDKRSSPSQLSIGSNFLAIKNYLDKNAKNYKDLFNRDIETQLFYDFTIAFVNLMNTLPNSLAELIPFFDYTALHTSDFIAKFFSAMNFPSIKPKVGEEFVYEFIRNKKTTLIDGEQEYKKTILSIKNQLQTKINKIHANVRFVIASFDQVKEALKAEIQSHLTSVRSTLANYEEVCLAERGGTTLENLVKSTQLQLNRFATTKAFFQENVSNCGFIPDASRKDIETKLEQLISSHIDTLNGVLRDLDHKLEMEFEFHRDNNLNFIQALNAIQAEAENLITANNTITLQPPQEDPSENIREAIKDLQDAEQQITRLRNKVNQIDRQLYTLAQSTEVRGEYKKIVRCYETSIDLVNTISLILDKKQNLFVETRNKLQEQFTRVKAEEKLAKLVKGFAQDELKRNLDEEQKALCQLSNDLLVIGENSIRCEEARNQLRSSKLVVKINLIERFQEVFSPLVNILLDLNDKPNFAAISDLTEIESCKSALDWLEDFIQRWFTSLECEKDYEDKINKISMECQDLLLAKHCLEANRSEIALGKINELPIFKKKNSNASTLKNLLEFLHIDAFELENISQKQRPIAVLKNFLKGKEKSTEKSLKYLLFKLNNKIAVTNDSIELCEKSIKLIKIFKTNKVCFNEAKLTLTTLYNQLISEQTDLERQEAELTYKIQAIESAEFNARKAIAERQVKVAALQKIEGLLKLNEKINGWPQIEENQKLSILISLRLELAIQIGKKADYGQFSIDTAILEERLLNKLTEKGYDFFVSKIFPPIKEKIDAINAIIWSHNPENIISLSDKLDDITQKLVELKDSVDKTNNEKIQSLFNHYLEETEYCLSSFLAYFREILVVSLTRASQINAKVIEDNNLDNSNAIDLLGEIDTTIDSGGFYIFSRHFDRLNAFMENINDFFIKRNEDLALLLSNNLQYLTNFHREEKVLLEHKKRLQKEIKENDISRRQTVASFFTNELDGYVNRRKMRYLLKDKIFKDDVEKRIKFVEKQKKHLELWSTDGDLNNLLTLLEKNKFNFPGLHLQPILNRLWLEIQEKDTLTPEGIEKRKELASAKLKLIDNPRFLQGINLLYSQIDELSKLKELGPPIIDELTIQLRYKTNDFIINNGDGKTLKKESVDKFRIEFMTLLHSHDDTLSKQNKFWQPFLINLAIGFLTLGLAIGIKLLSSKLSTGRATFFFADTAALNHVNLIERTAREIMAPAG